MRNNPGGLLRAGLDVARLWLDGEAAVFNVQGRDEDGRMAVTQVLGWGATDPLLAARLLCWHGLYFYASAQGRAAPLPHTVH